MRLFNHFVLVFYLGIHFLVGSCKKRSKKEAAAEEPILCKAMPYAMPCKGGGTAGKAQEEEAQEESSKAHEMPEASDAPPKGRRRQRSSHSRDRRRHSREGTGGQASDAPAPQRGKHTGGVTAVMVNMSVAAVVVNMSPESQPAEGPRIDL